MPESRRPRLRPWKKSTSGVFFFHPPSCQLQYCKERLSWSKVSSKAQEKKWLTVSPWSYLSYLKLLEYLLCPWNPRSILQLLFLHLGLDCQLDIRSCCGDSRPHEGDDNLSNSLSSFLLIHGADTRLPNLIDVMKVISSKSEVNGGT